MQSPRAAYTGLSFTGFSFAPQLQAALLLGTAGSLEAGGDLLCVGQGHVAAQGLPSLCPAAEDDVQAPAVPTAQQASASAELVDGYQLHITGDAIDAVQSPVCASAQVRHMPPTLHAC